MATLAEVARSVDLGAGVASARLSIAARAAAVALGAAVVASVAGPLAAVARPVALSSAVIGAERGALGAAAAGIGPLRPLTFAGEQVPPGAAWGPLAGPGAALVTLMDAASIARSLAVPKSSAPFVSAFDIGAAAGMPALYAAWPLPAGACIAPKLGALAIARGEAWTWDESGQIVIAGRVLIGASGVPIVATAATWVDTYVTRIVEAVAHDVGMAAVVSGAERDHWLSVQRTANAAGIARLAVALRNPALDSDQRAALAADLAFLQIAV